MATSAQRKDAKSGDGTTNYHTHALTRGLSVLELLSREAPPLTFIELHERTGLPKSTLVRLLSALADTQFIVRVDDRPAYRLGHKVMDLAEAYVSSLDISSLAHGYLDELSRETRQTSNLGVLDGDQVLHVCVRTPNRPLRFETAAGSRANTYCTGLGKCLLAAVDPEEVVRHMAAEPFQPFTPRTITDRKELEKELRKIARRGYAFDDQEFSEGLRCLAVPVVVDGETLAAVSVSGPSGEFGVDQQRVYLRFLHDTAARLADDADVAAALRNIATRIRRTMTSSDA